MTNSLKESKSLLEVWELKEMAYKEVEKLEIDNALSERLLKSIKTVNELGLSTNKNFKKVI